VCKVVLITVLVQLSFVSTLTHSHLWWISGIVRRAVALGRLLQNPVTMVASLCGPTKEILSLRLHPMQNSLTNEELYEAIERVMVTVVNQVGGVSYSCNGVLFWW
jgi:ABC-type phosphate/phosphonate transport system permease subunit